MRAKHYKGKKACLIGGLIGAVLVSGLFSDDTAKAQSIAESEQVAKQATKQVAKKVTYELTPKTELETTQHQGVSSRYGQEGLIHEFWGTEGYYNVAYSDEKKVYIHRFDQNMKQKDCLIIPMDLEFVGNVCQDTDGNYYIVYGKYDESETNLGSAVVLSVVKYDNSGKKLNRVTYTGKQAGGNDDIGFGTAMPFDFGNCNTLIDSEGVLVVRYGRVMYNGHQSSHSLYINTKTMEKLTYAAPYNSHSFDQYVIETSDGGYLFADRGDAFERGFVLSRMSKTSNQINVFVPFHFGNGYIYQETYASLAGIAELSNGYALVGTSEKSISYNKPSVDYYNESRNVMMQVVKKDFTSQSTNSADAQVLSGETRIPTGTYTSDGYCKANSKDYGVKWLTNYTGYEYASNAKLLELGDDRLLIMWEKMEYLSEPAEDDDFYEGDSKFISTHYMIVSSTGEIVQKDTLIEDSRLAAYCQPVYKDGCVYWTTVSDYHEAYSMKLHKLYVGQYQDAKIPVTKLTTNHTIMIGIGETVSLNYKITPSNAGNQKVYVVYDRSIDYEEGFNVKIGKDGRVTGTDLGQDEVYIISADNPAIYQKVTIIVADTAPKNVKIVQQSCAYAGKIKLSWSKTKLGSMYQIYRSETKNGTYERVGETDKLYYYDTNLTLGKTYYYKVASGSRWDDDLNFSAPVKYYTLKTPSSYQLASKKAKQVTVSWNKVSSATFYEVYRYDTTSKKYVLIKTIYNGSTVSFTDTKLTSGKTYRYKIRAGKVNSKLTSYSNYTIIKSVKVK